MKNLGLIMCVVVGALLLAACEPFGDKDAEGLKKACSAAPAKMRNAPKLPAGFPVPLTMSIVSVQKDGPATVATGWMDKQIGDAHQSFSQALKGAAGFTITKEEQDKADSEVNFSGNGKSGQVKMVQECKSRTSVTITIRPA